MNRGDPVTVVREGRLLHGHVTAWTPVYFVWRISTDSSTVPYSCHFDDEHITWCHGHISRAAASPLLAAAALAGGE